MGDIKLGLPPITNGFLWFPEVDLEFGTMLVVTLTSRKERWERKKHSGVWRNEIRMAVLLSKTDMGGRRCGWVPAGALQRGRAGQKWQQQ